MPVSRRAFVAGLAATPVLTSVSAVAQAATTALSPDRFDPWIEVDAAALRKNVAVVSSLASKRPILAVIKNNAYGLGLTTVASVLDPIPQIKGFAVVKAEAAIAMRESGNLCCSWDCSLTRTVRNFCAATFS